MEIWLAFIILIIGLILLVKGADLFVDGASNLAKHFGVSALVVGLTVVAFGTSLPEAAVSISSQIQGLDDVSLGNIIGSNMFNLFFILGVSALFSPLIVKKEILKRDLPLSIIATVILILMTLFFHSNGNKAITRVEGLVLFLSLIIYVIYLIKHSLKESAQNNDQQLFTVTEVAEVESKAIFTKKKAAIYTIIGLIGVVGGGILVTNGAKEIALFFGMSEWLVGLTIVSVGTSLPELITSVVAAFKKEVDIAVGNVVGSNLFNILFVLGFSSIIKPIKFNDGVMFDLLFLAIGSILISLLALRKKRFGKLEGAIMVAMYIGYFAYIIVRELN